VTYYHFLYRFESCKKEWSMSHSGIGLYPPLKANRDRFWGEEGLAAVIAGGCACPFFKRSVKGARLRKA